MNSRIQIFAADDRTGDGIIPTLCVLEELHRHRDLNLYRTWRGKIAKRGGQMVAISTAGEPDGEFEAMRKRIRDEAEHSEQQGAFLRAVAGTTVLHEWALADGADPDDIMQVKMANPLAAITVESLRQKHDSKALTPSHWLRFVCGLPARLGAWIEPPMWDALATETGGLEDGDKAYLAVRVGAGAGIGIASPREGGAVAVGAIMLPPPQAGGRVPLETVEGAIHELCKLYEVVEIAYDPDQFMRSAELLQDQGLPMIDVPQRPTRLAQATSTMWRLVSAGLLSHNGNPELRAQVLAGRTKDTLQGWRLEPTASTAGLIALVVAAHQATGAPADPPRFIAL